MTDPLPARPTFRQRLLGIFVFWQLVFLLGANYLFLVVCMSRDKPSELSASCWSALTRYQRFTGQTQYWRLYSPVLKEARYPTVTLNGTDELRSSFEPVTISRYFRLPGCADRLYHFDGNLALLYGASEDAAPAGLSEGELEQRRKNIYNHRVTELRRNWQVLQRYAMWRIEQWQPVPESGEVVVSFRVYRTPLPPDSPWSDPVAKPLFRWRLGENKPPEGFLPVELFDFRKQEFVKIPERDATEP